MKKIELTCTWLLAFLFFALMAVASPATAQTYNTTDIAAINAIIAAHPELGTPANPDDGSVLPTTVSGVTIATSSVTPHRITGLTITNVTVTGLLDVSGLTELVSLKCNNNQLTGLKVSGLTKLQNFNCGTNNLTTLDLSGLTSLDNIWCEKNQITTLNLSGLINLKLLNCYNNQLATLDVSALTALVSLYCYNNKLTQLEAAGTTLQILACYNNQLTDLDVSMLTGLTNLSCHTNQITDLDVSTLINLTSLYCNDNQLTDLDVSALIKLTTLDCQRNQLADLDVSTLMELTALYCNDNQITDLDVAALIKLKRLSCNNNLLTDLDVAALTDLIAINCSSNQITALDVAALTSLTDLFCNNNQIAELDASALASLTFLYAYNNQLTKLLLNSAAPLTYCYFFTQTLTLPMVWNSATLRCEGAIALTNVSSFNPSAFTNDATHLLVADDTYPSVSVVTTTGVAGKDLTTTINLTYDIPVTDVSLNKAATTLFVGATEQLTATITTSSSTNPNVTWSSSDDNIATVAQDGTITAVAAGNVTITVTTDGGPPTAICDVTVIIPYAVTVIGGAGATGSGTYAESATVSISAGTVPAGYAFSHWTASPSVSFASATSASTTFAMPAASVTVTAHFALIPEPAPDPDLTDIYGAISLIQFTIIQIPQAAANTETDARKWLEEYLRELFNQHHYYVSVTAIRFSLFEAAVKGTTANVSGVHGNVTFSAIFSKGSHSVQVSFIHGRIVATPHVNTGNEVAAKASLKAISEGGSLLISGLSVGDDLQLYDISGRLIYNVKAEAAEIRVAVARGVYILSSGKSRIKVIAR